MASDARMELVERGRIELGLEARVDLLDYGLPQLTTWLVRTAERTRTLSTFLARHVSIEARNMRFCGFGLG